MLIRDGILLNWRNEKGLSQSKSARGVNITQEYWHVLERGKMVPSIKVLQVISEVTGLKKSILLGEAKGGRRA